MARYDPRRSRLAKVQELQEINGSLVQEVNLLRSMVQKLMQENATLRAQVSQVMMERNELQAHLKEDSAKTPTKNPDDPDYARPLTKVERQIQMERQQAVEAKQKEELDEISKDKDKLFKKISIAQQKHQQISDHHSGQQQKNESPDPHYNTPTKHPIPSDRSSGRTDSTTGSRTDSVGENRASNRAKGSPKDPAGTTPRGRLEEIKGFPTGNEYPESSEESAAFATEDEIQDFGTLDAGPSQDAIVMATEQITKKIQELLLEAQNGRNSRYIPCSSNISAAVNDMANLFPKHPSSEGVRMALRLMITSAARLQVECRSSVLPDRNIDQAMLTQQVIQCAYDIAKAAKQLVTTYNSGI